MASPPIPFITVSGLPVASVQFIQNPPRVSSPFSTVRGTTGTLAVTGCRMKRRVLGNPGGGPSAA